VSGVHVARLKRRARAFLAEAEEASDPDLAMFFLEQAAQLYIKSVYYELFGAPLRGHGLRELLGILSKALSDAGYDAEADTVMEYVAKRRRILAVLELAYTAARYGDTDYDWNNVRAALEAVKELIGLLDRVAGRVKLG